jgi:D-xylulose reductase
VYSFPFEEAATAFNTTHNGKSEDAKGVIKAIISGPDVATTDI